MNLFVEIREGFGISWDAIRANKMRSVLTTLGIVIGIVTVTLMGTAIEGLDRAFLKSISALGADVFYVQRNNWMTRTWEAWLKERNRRPDPACRSRGAGPAIDACRRRRAHRR